MFDHQEDDGPCEFQNEFQAAHAAAHLEYSAAGKIGVDPRIQDVINAGMFAVVLVGSVYCPYTDGFLGTKVTLVGVFESEGAARHECNRLSVENEIGEEDYSYEVRGVPAPQPEPELLPDTSDIPF